MLCNGGGASMQATSRTLKALSYGQRHASIKSHICMDGCFMVLIFLQWYQIWMSLRKISRRGVGNLKFVLKENGYGSN